MKMIHVLILSALLGVIIGFATPTPSWAGCYADGAKLPTILGPTRLQLLQLHRRYDSSATAKAC